MDEELIELLGGLLDTCKAQGLRRPLTVTVISSGRILFCMRVNTDAKAELFHRNPDQARRLPITVVVVDADGERVRGRITADDPDVLVVSHCRWRYGWRCYFRSRRDGGEALPSARSPARLLGVSDADRGSREAISNATAWKAVRA